MKSLVESKTEVTEQRTGTVSTSLQNITQRIIRVNEERYELSEYLPGEATPETVAWMLKKLKGCYPDTTVEVLDNLIEMLKAENWSDERIKDAVHNLIMNHRYPRISPADVLSYDKRRRLYTHHELQVKFHKEFGSEYGRWGGYEKIKIPYEPEEKHELYPDKDTRPPETRYLVFYAKKQLDEFISKKNTLRIQDKQAF